MYDLLLKGGTVLDPSQGLHERRDVAIVGGVIRQLASSISADEAAHVLSVEGKFVTPGLIDIHTHLYRTGRNTNHPDIAGVRAGVTTVADAGGPGRNDFRDFCDFVLPQTQTRVYSFLNISGDYDLAAVPRVSDVDVAGVVQIARENPELVRGLKVLVEPRWVQAVGLKHVELSKRVAREAGIRLMMHIGDIGPRNQTTTPPEVTVRAVSMLDRGDILTHIFTPLTGGALDREGRLLPQIREAQQRGVLVDTAYGDTGFGWGRADAVLAQNLIPDTIATDQEVHPGDGMRRRSDRGLLEYAAFFFVLGFSLDDVVRMTTVNAARALGIAGRAGSLAVGREADVSVFEVQEGEWRLTDATGISRRSSKALVPALTIKGGRVIERGEAPHPWGWTPPPLAEAAVRAGGAF